jgi:hypothetical protein
MDENQKKDIQKMIDEAVERYAAYTTRKVGDTPTDAIQLTNKRYVDNQVGGIDTATNFGGNGSDGALSAGGTIDLGSSSYVVKNYTTINIAVGQTIEFSNPNSAGTVVIFKATGDVNIGGAIDLQGDGAIFGSGGGVATSGSAGSGSPGNAGTEINTDIILFQGSVAGRGGPGGHQSIGGTLAGGVAGTTPPNRVFYTFTGTTDSGKIDGRRGIYICCGAGGAGGGGGGDNNSGDTGNTAGTGASGGRGGGALLIECAGTLTFTGSIIASGLDGSQGNQPVAGAPPPDEGTYGCGGGGGGGAAGMVVILAKDIADQSGTITTAGGAGGAGGSSNLGTNNLSCDPGGGGGGGGAASFVAAGGAGGAPGDADQNGSNGSAAAGTGAGGGGGGGAGCRRTGTKTGGSGGAGGSSYGGLIIEVG